jgi:hypothetical protein
MRLNKSVITRRSGRISLRGPITRLRPQRHIGIGRAGSIHLRPTSPPTFEFLLPPDIISSSAITLPRDRLNTDVLRRARTNYPCPTQNPEQIGRVNTGITVRIQHRKHRHRWRRVLNANSTALAVDGILNFDPPVLGC